MAFLHCVFQTQHYFCVCGFVFFVWVCLFVFFLFGFFVDMFVSAVSCITQLLVGYVMCSIFFVQGPLATIRYKPGAQTLSHTQINILIILLFQISNIFFLIKPNKFCFKSSQTYICFKQYVM